MTTKRISVTEFLTYFSDIDDINYQNKIIVFSEGYSDEEYDKIYDLLRNKWKVNKLRRLNKLVGHNGSGPVYDMYDDNYKLIERCLILVENCDLEVINDAYGLWEYLDMDYDLYLVCPEIKEDFVMTNIEKFKEIFGLEIDAKGQVDLCDIIDHNVCINSHSCPECLIHNFWEKEYKKNRRKDETEH